MLYERHGSGAATFERAGGAGLVFSRDSALRLPGKAGAGHRSRRDANRPFAPAVRRPLVAARGRCRAGSGADRPGDASAAQSGANRAGCWDWSGSPASRYANLEVFNHDWNCDAALVHARQFVGVRNSRNLAGPAVAGRARADQFPHPRLRRGARPGAGLSARGGGFFGGQQILLPGDFRTRSC